MATPRVFPTSRIVFLRAQAARQRNETTKRRETLDGFVAPTRENSGIGVVSQEFMLIFAYPSSQEAYSRMVATRPAKGGRHGRHRQE
jgi:hypothetical protein